jgi:hypothetical protein
VRIPYPERIPFKGAVYFALALFIIQWLEGTALYFCIGCSIFILLATVTFNTAGGLTRASGAYVFFYSMLVVVVGLCYKAYLGEPAQTNLTDPRTDIEAYIGSMVAMYAAVVVSRRFSRKTGLLQDLLKERDMYRASVGCMLFGALAGFGIALLGESGSQIRTAFNQLNQLIPLGIIIGVMYEIRSSKGTRSSNLFIVLGVAYVFFLGITSFSKQALFTPIVCWLLPVWALKYRLSAIQIASCCLFAFISFHYLVPYSQYGRDQIPEHATLSQRFAIGSRLLENPEETRRKYLQQQDEGAYQGGNALGSYYNSPQGFWDRLQFLSIDDSLIHFTDQGHTFGLLPVEVSFANVIPHFLWPNKPAMNLGNMYYHELNGEAQGEGDTTTGISFSPTAEAYHLERWIGIFVLAPILWIMLFTLYDSLLGDAYKSPWGLLAMVVIAHVAPEGGITDCIYLCSYGVEAVLFCAFFAAWFAAPIGTAIIGPDRKSPESRLPMRPRFALRIPR